MSFQGQLRTEKFSTMVTSVAGCQWERVVSHELMFCRERVQTKHREQTTPILGPRLFVLIQSSKSYVLNVIIENKETRNPVEGEKTSLKARVKRRKNNLLF